MSEILLAIPRFEAPGTHFLLSVKWIANDPNFNLSTPCFIDKIKMKNIKEDVVKSQ